ncbi:uncharacterized protein LOC128126361 [Lactuca sativa]|uniref:uncharacterized protein LOC128126361 n=1 Tax=Lactuca sativa TaxID=4236 RepID=UPI0022AF1BA0|nr:uncharacterized protein LOC128126361 [Lactuca sativa]
MPYQRKNVVSGLGSLALVSKGKSSIKEEEELDLADFDLTGEEYANDGGSINSDEFGGMEVWSTYSEDDEVRKPTHGKAMMAKAEHSMGRCFAVTKEDFVDCSELAKNEPKSNKNLIFENSVEFAHSSTDKSKVFKAKAIVYQKVQTTPNQQRRRDEESFSKNLMESESYVKKLRATKDASQDIFPQNGKVTISISNLFDQFMLLFDEPQKAIDSESIAKDNKVDNIKQVIDDAARKMADDQSKGTERADRSGPSSDHPTVEGEGSSPHYDQGSSFQGEDSSTNTSTSTDIPTNERGTNAGPKQESFFDREKTQLVQSILSLSKHSEISCGRFWTIITKWAMDRNGVPIMADSLLSSIATFHTTKIIVTDPTKFSYIGFIPKTMLGSISASSNLLQQYRKRKSVGPRELTPTMLRSIEEADKPAKKGKKPESQKEGPKKPARRLILQSSSEWDSEYVPPKQKNAPSSDSENKSSDEEALGRGDTPPRSPTPEIQVRSLPPSPPPVTIPTSIPPISQTTTSQPLTSIPIPTPIFTDTTSTTTTKPTFIIPKPPVTEPTFTTEPHLTTEAPTSSKPLSPTPSTETTLILGGEDLEFDSIYFSPYQVQSEDDDDEPITKRHLKAVNDKLDQLLSSSSLGAYSDAALNALFS